MINFKTQVEQGREKIIIDDEAYDSIIDAATNLKIDAETKLKEYQAESARIAPELDKARAAAWKDDATEEEEAKYEELQAKQNEIDKHIDYLDDLIYKLEK